MAGANLSTIDPILKNQYLPPIREQLNNDIRLVKRIGTDYDSVVGKNFTIPMHYGRNWGTGARGDGQQLMEAGAQAYKESIVPMRYIYGRIQLTGPSIKAAASNAGAFARTLASEIKGVTRDIKKDLNRMLAGNGTGVLTVCGVTSGSTTVNVASTARLKPGMPIDVLLLADGTTGTGAVNRTVVSITNATSFVISGAAITTAATYGVYRHGNRNIEVMGLEGIISDADIPNGYGAFQGLAVGAHPWHKSLIVPVNGAITNTALQKLIDDVEQAGDGEVNALYTTYGVRRAYQALLMAKKEYSNIRKLDGEAEVSYNDMPMFVDSDIGAGIVYGVDESMMQVYKMADFDWMDMDGAILSRVSGYDAYEAILYCYMELGMFARNAFAKMTGVTEA